MLPNDVVPRSTLFRINRLQNEIDIIEHILSDSLTNPSDGDLDV